MIKVYFEMENPKYAELVAIFNDTKTYAECFPALQELCERSRFDYITESVDDSKRISDLN